MSAVITQKRTTKPIDEVPRKAFRDYSVTLKRTARESGEAFKKIVRAQLKNATSQEEMKSILYHAANDTFEQYANATGTLSCDFFEAYIKGAKQTEIAPVPKYIKKRLYEHIEDILAGRAADDEGVLEAIANHVITESYHHGNRTTKHNAIRNGLRYARVPSGKACAFCLMLASRGFVYHSKTSAGEDKGHYHNHCHCAVVAGNLKMKVSGYDPDGLNERMNELAASLGIDDWAAAAADKELTKVLNRELAERDRCWVLNGKVPFVEFENKLAKKNAHDHEIEQAKRLSRHGIKCVFQVDYERVDKKGTLIGKPDLSNGIELKSLTNTSNLERRIKKSLHNAKRKKGFKSCNFDATGTSFSNDEIYKAINSQAMKKRINRVSFIDRNGDYHVIKIRGATAPGQNPEVFAPH